MSWESLEHFMEQNRNALEPAMASQETVSESLCQQIVEIVDRVTLEAGLSLRDAALTYREIASECRDRANGLDSEADTNDRLDA